MSVATEANSLLPPDLQVKRNSGKPSCPGAFAWVGMQPLSRVHCLCVLLPYTHEGCSFLGSRMACGTLPGCKASNASGTSSLPGPARRPRSQPCAHRPVPRRAADRVRVRPSDVAAPAKPHLGAGALRGRQRRAGPGARRRGAPSNTSAAGAARSWRRCGGSGKPAGGVRDGVSRGTGRAGERAAGTATDRTVSPTWLCFHGRSHNVRAVGVVFGCRYVRATRAGNIHVTRPLRSAGKPLVAA